MAQSGRREGAREGRSGTPLVASGTASVIVPVVTVVTVVIPVVVPATRARAAAARARAAPPWPVVGRDRGWWRQGLVETGAGGDRGWWRQGLVETGAGGDRGWWRRVAAAGAGRGRGRRAEALRGGQRAARAAGHGRREPQGMRGGRREVRGMGGGRGELLHMGRHALQPRRPHPPQSFGRTGPGRGPARRARRGKARFKRAGPPLPHARAAADAGQLEGDGLIHLLEHGSAVTGSADDVHCTPSGPRGVSLSRAGVHPER